MIKDQAPLVLNTVTPSAVKNKRVLVKVDYNVPLKKKGAGWVVADTSRLEASLPTLQFLRQQGAKIILTSHLGRPNGKVVEAARLNPVATELQKLLKVPVKKLDVTVGPEAKKAALALKAGEVLLLENSRFHPGETKNDASFARQLADLAEVYVNDGFSASHRTHASVVGVTDFLPAYAGLALAEEVKALGSLMRSPKRPFVALVGGAKISDKVEAIAHLSNIADVVLVGGGVANNFLKAEGVEVFRSYLEDVPVDQQKQGKSYVAIAGKLMKDTQAEKMLLYGYIPLPKIVYPSDVVATESLDSPKNVKVLDLTNGNHQEERANWIFADIGPKTRKLYQDIIAQAKTVFWNGPMGVFEQPEFSAGTKAVAQALAQNSGQTITGGGDTIRALNAFGVSKKIDYISAAGGAALEFLGGNMLPGLKPLVKHV